MYATPKTTAASSTDGNRRVAQCSAAASIRSAEKPPNLLRSGAWANRTLIWDSCAVLVLLCSNCYATFCLLELKVLSKPFDILKCVHRRTRTSSQKRTRIYTRMYKCKVCLFMLFIHIFLLLFLPSRESPQCKFQYQPLSYLIECPRDIVRSKALSSYIRHHLT